jgi:RimJ/RimL family protein N-acetyltransferase
MPNPLPSAIPDRWAIRLQTSLFMQVFPELNTNRLRLRKVTVEDVSSLVKYANNKKISENTLNIPYPYGEPDAVFRISYVHQGFKSKTRYIFAIIIKDSEELIGEISLHLDNSRTIAQLAYWIGEPFWNKGIATEAATAILKFGLEKLMLSMIFAECHFENNASEKVLLNSGLKKYGVNGSVVQYRLINQEFEKQTNTEDDLK